MDVDLADLTRKIEVLATEVKSGTEAILRRIDLLEKEVEKLDGAFRGTGTGPGLAGRIDQLERTLPSEERLRTVEARLCTMEAVEDRRKWLVRTIGGAAVVSLIGMVLKWVLG